MSNSAMGDYSPSLTEILGIKLGLVGWPKVGVLGPNYFAPPSVERELFEHLSTGKSISARSKRRLAAVRARVVNFFGFVNFGQAFVPRPARAFADEVATFLVQLKEQTDIWRVDGIFHALDMRAAEQRILIRVIAKCAPVIFNMGFADSTAHSSQVSRLTASIVAHVLEGRPSQVLQGTIGGYLHDPKLHPTLDLDHQNLATHPVIASALAYSALHDSIIYRELLDYFHGNTTKAELFIVGIVDGLGVNNDSRFVQMMVILPWFVKRTSELFGKAVGEGFKAVMEARLESGANDTAPPKLPEQLWGCLSQFSVDSGIQGINSDAWVKAVHEANISQHPLTLFHRLLLGKQVLSTEELERLRTVLSTATPSPILKARIQATTLLHHHLEVTTSGLKFAKGLVSGDPMMLSPHKVAAVYKNAVLERLASYIKSFDDNIRLLPRVAQAMGPLWQRAVYLSMLSAADHLNGTTLLRTFAAAHKTSSVADSVNDLRSLLLTASTWGEFAQAAGGMDNEHVKKVLVELESAYVAVVNQYRQAIYASKGELNRFYPAR